MRIVSGFLRGRRFTPPANLAVRPTTDIAKESLFNILNNHIDFQNIKALDLFAGTGSISFELISRGCISVTSIDSNFKSTDFIKKTAEAFKIDNIHIVKTNVFNFLKFINSPFDLIFADPPYDMEGILTIPDIIFEKNILSKSGFLIIEHSREINFENHPQFYEHRLYGKVNFTFFQL
ncbi:MAG: 16S rRNA (guanine(966)-N(2))-methyltransferase RsmD [Bacteroidales bacterium]